MLTTWMNSNAIVPWEELISEGPAGLPTVTTVR